MVDISSQDTYEKHASNFRQCYFIAKKLNNDPKLVFIILGANYTPDTTMGSPGDLLPALNPPMIQV